MLRLYYYRVLLVLIFNIYYTSYNIWHGEYFTPNTNSNPNQTYIEIHTYTKNIHTYIYTVYVYMYTHTYTVIILFFIYFWNNSTKQPNCDCQEGQTALCRLSHFLNFHLILGSFPFSFMNLKKPTAICFDRCLFWGSSQSSAWFFWIVTQDL